MPLRTAPGMRERSPNVWELIVEAGVDPVTGRRRQISRVFRGTLREAKTARAALLTEVSKGRHTATRVTVASLFSNWIAELERKGRSPNTVAGYRHTYERNIKPTLENVPVAKVNTKMLTDLYGAHQKRGLAPRTVYQIHACLSSMFTQACRWGWRDSNPAQWAEPPSIPNTTPTVPTPENVLALIEAAERSRRPQHARVIRLAATTGLRRAELCALRWDRDVDWDMAALTVSRGIAAMNGEPLVEISTKNRRIRTVAVDKVTLTVLEDQRSMLTERAAACGTELMPNAYVFSDAADGSEPWNPNMVTRYFDRLRRRAGLEHLRFHDLRKFMETYAQDLGFSPVQVAMRAGHDPSIAAKHYTGKLREVDRALADAVGELLANA